MNKTLSFLFLMAGFLTGPVYAQSGRLTSPIFIQGIHCENFVEFYPGGHLKRSSLASAQNISHVDLPAHTMVCFNPDKSIRYFFLSQPAYVGGYLCKGEGHDWMMKVYPDGKPQLIWLERDQLIQGVPCLAASILKDLIGGSVGVHFHDNGRLARCKLAEAFTCEGKQFKRGEVIRFDRNGKLIIQ